MEMVGQTSLIACSSILWGAPHGPQKGSSNMADEVKVATTKQPENERIADEKKALRDREDDRRYAWFRGSVDEELVREIHRLTANGKL